MTSAFVGSSSGLTRQRLRGRRYIQLSRDLYVLRDEVVDLRARVVAAQLALPDGIACAWTAAELLGLPVRREESVHLARLPGAARSERAGTHVHRLVVPPAEQETVDGMAVTSGPRTWLDLAAHLDLEDLVALGDVVARRWSAEALKEVLGRARSRPGVVLARRAVTLIDPRADSPAETRHRLRLHAAGFTGLRHGVVVTDEAGQWLSAPDLADEAARVALQHEGEVHFLAGVEQRRSDVMRDELTREQGWEVVVVSALDERRPGQVTERVTAAYLRAAAVRGEAVLPVRLRRGEGCAPAGGPEPGRMTTLSGWCALACVEGRVVPQRAVRNRGGSRP